MVHYQVVEIPGSRKTLGLAYFDQERSGRPRKEEHGVCQNGKQGVDLIEGGGVVVRHRWCPNFPISLETGNRIKGVCFL